MHIIIPKEHKIGSEKIIEEIKMEQNSNLRFDAKETKEVLAFAIALGSAIKDSLEDDKITFGDLPNFFKVVQTIVPALSDIDEVAIEFAMMSSQEADDLKSFVKDNLDIEDSKIDNFIKQAFSVALDLWLLINDNFIKPQGTEKEKFSLDKETNEEADEETKAGE